MVNVNRSFSLQALAFRGATLSLLTSLRGLNIVATPPQESSAFRSNPLVSSYLCFLFVSQSSFLLPCLWRRGVILLSFGTVMVFYVFSCCMFNVFCHDKWLFFFCTVDAVLWLSVKVALTGPTSLGSFWVVRR